MAEKESIEKERIEFFKKRRYGPLQPLDTSG